MRTVNVFAGAVLLAATAGMDGALAFEQWRSRERAPVAASAEPQGTMKDGLPDGVVARADGGGDVAAAWYVGPTTRYRHGILGDAVEAGGLRVETADGRVLTVTLPQSEVFEDRYPRLADLDGDGSVEIVTIRSSLTRGASVTVYGLEGGAIVEKAATGFIGRSNRWLNIAGIAPFLGTGANEIAFVTTPHIGGTLSLWAYSAGKLRRVASLPGFSNHAIGSREMRLSAVADVDGDGRPDLAVPSDDRRVLRIVRFGPDGMTEIARASLPARIDKPVDVTSAAGKTRFTVGLDDGSTHDVFR